MSASKPRLRAVFMGSPEFAVPCLEATARTTNLVVVVTQPDRPAGRGRKLTPPAVKRAATEMGVEVLQPEKVRDGTLANALRALDPDVIIVVAYGRILPTEILDLPAHGCINVHASLLPRWRGAAPIQRAVLAGDAETGISIMRMDEGCDTGPVYEMHATPIAANETAGQLFERLSKLGGEVLERFLMRFPEVPEAREQPSEGVVHAAKLDKGEGRVDWTMDGDRVCDHVRGMDPWPGAFADRGGERIRLFDARRPEKSRRVSEAPGTVLSVGDDGIEIACGRGSVVIGQLQAAGKRRVAAAAYAQGHPFADGERLA